MKYLTNHESLHVQYTYQHTLTILQNNNSGNMSDMEECSGSIFWVYLS